MGVTCAPGWCGHKGLHGVQAARMHRKGRLAGSWTMAETADPANASSPTRGEAMLGGLGIMRYSPLPRPSDKH